MRTLNFIESDDNSQFALQWEIVLKIGNSLHDRFSSLDPNGNMIQRGGEIGDDPARRRRYPHSFVAQPIIPLMRRKHFFFIGLLILRPDFLSRIRADSSESICKRSSGQIIIIKRHRDNYCKIFTVIIC